MKITNVDSSISFTMSFSKEDVSRLVKITTAVEDVFDCASHELSQGAVNIDYEDLEMAQEGLELLYEMVKSLEDLR